MIPWTALGRAPIPGSSDPDNPEELCLFRRGDEFSIRISGYLSELMNSRRHASEEALAELACALIAGRARPRVLVGGLGMGFTLAATLRATGPGAEIVVAELVPEVVDWNKGPLGACAGHPLSDARTQVHVGDVAELLQRVDAFDAVLLDVDNGPEGMVRRENDRLYSAAGLAATLKALRPGGVLAVWSVEPDPAFSARLKKAGFRVKVETARAREGKGARHTIWLAQKGAQRRDQGASARSTRRPNPVSTS